jgi:Asp-tRNA(Asn)/Glu-tRNA(Gln) amidotransferase A subunit family amidase
VEPEVAALVETAARLIASHGASLSAMAQPIDFDLAPAFDEIFSVRAAMERDELPADRRFEALDFINRYCDAGDRLSAKAYLRAVEAMDRAKAAFVEALSPFDFVLAPVLPMVGFAADVAGPDPDRPSRHVNFTSLVNQIGWPAASICCGITKAGLPVGLQIIAARNRDVEILGLSAAYEQMRGFAVGFPDI